MTYDDHIEWAKQQFYTLEKKKQQIILELAERLEKEGMNPEKINDYVSEKLVDAGYVTDRYVSKTLPEKYKQKIKVEAGKQKGKSKKEILTVVTNKGSAELSSADGENDEEDEEQGKDEPIQKRLESIDATPQGGWEAPDEDFLEKKLARAEEELNDLSYQLGEKDKTIAQLQELVKKEAFKPASESNNTEVYERIALPILRSKLTALTNRHWHFVKATIERLS